jgi:PAS domain S-box-containing protein
MEDKVHESGKHFRDLIYNLKQGVILQDGQGKVIVCNQSVLDMLGLNEDQLMKKTAPDRGWHVSREDGPDYAMEPIPGARVLATRKPVRDMVMGVYRPNTQDRVWLLINAEPLMDDSGNIVNVICSYTDITEQKRLSQALIEQKVQKQKQITQAAIDGQEKERQQIGKELHDNINQHLTTTRLYLEVAREKAQGEVLEMITHSHKTLVSIINEIRNLSQSLVPPTLGDLGLVESIQELSDSIRRTHAFQIDLFCKYFNEAGLPENLKLMLFRITQEQVNNIVKHSRAKNIRIRLQSDAENISLIIADDGQGFEPSLSRRGMGFNNITNRASLFNGRVDIISAPEKGCSLQVLIPLNLQEDLNS